MTKSRILANSFVAFHQLAEYLGESMRRFHFLYIATATAVLGLVFLVIALLVRTGLPSSDVIAREATLRPIIKVSDFSPGDVKIVQLNNLPVIVWRHKNSRILGISEEVFADDANLTLDQEWFFALAKFPNRFQYVLLRAGEYGGFFEGRYAAHFDLSGRIRKGGGSENLTVIPAEYVDDGESILLDLTGRTP
ncbi:MAG: hypothetical protein N4A53_16255 [Pelagimonas sp.]|jgi:ubiquinol-cytochrome c reductase iron-sulfur subunit|nr:hypothetical protein [Pelagimonas sp.]